MIIHGNCFDELPKLDDGSVDHVITDPPYYIDYQGNEWDNNERSLLYNTKMISEFNRITKPTSNILIFQGWSHVSEVISCGLSVGWTLKNWIIWDRVKGRGAKTNFTSTREDILWFTKTKEYPFNKIYSNTPKKTKGMGLKNNQPNRSLSNVWTDISPLVPWSKEYNKHPTQKPLQLMERLVTIFTLPGDLVIDPFCGSGTTLVALKKLGRNYIGIEKESLYFDITKNRLGEKDEENQAVKS